ncbi:MAG TPA: hypothetical protein VFO16_06110 [Pseudonocardiaceae bacterium]|nr:hypothetical protein [Pseudonocardiaceae bacterium]
MASPRDAAADDYDERTEGKGHLRALLLEAGVSSKWSTRTLATRCGHQLSSETWRRLAAPVDKAHPWEPYVLRIVAETLRGLGANITLAAIEHAALTDSGYLGFANLQSGDHMADVAMSLVQRLTPDERVQFLKDLIALVAGR